MFVEKSRRGRRINFKNSMEWIVEFCKSSLFQASEIVWQRSSGSREEKWLCRGTINSEVKADSHNFVE